MEAFIIIDMQEYYIGNRRGSKEFEGVIDHINYTASLFRKSEKPVFIVCDLSEGDGPEFNNVKELVVHESDQEILKYENNSFWETTFHQQLQQADVDFVILSGNAAEYCVTATYFGSLERGYKTVILQNGVLAVTEKGLQSLNELRPLISYTGLSHFIK